MMPSFPALILMLASIPLLVPRLADTIAARYPPGAGAPWRLTRAIAACAVVVVLIPLIVLGTARRQDGPRTVKNDAQHTSIPVTGAFGLAATTANGKAMLSWKPPYHGSVGTYYAVLRSRPTFPDPSNPEERTVEDGVVCRPRLNGSSQDCHLFMRQIAATKKLTFTDQAAAGKMDVPGRARSQLAERSDPLATCSS